MKDNFQNFIETLETPNTKKVAKFLQELGKYDYSNCTLNDVIQIILSMNPTSPRAITTICYMLGEYAKFLKYDKLYDLIRNIDRNELWAIAKPNAPRKFISNSMFEEAYHDLGVYEEFNSLYYQMLFRCIYEGIYSDDMSVIKNLRASDINGNIVTLHHDNGHSYSMEISEELSSGLKELGSVHIWERKNRFSICKIKIYGLYHDSCFKVEIRDGSSKYSYRYSYYRNLRKIVKEYLEHNVSPLQVYISGIAYRIALKLKDNNISLEDAFAYDNRNRVVSKIIGDELKRCSYDIDIRNFREHVQGHLEVFKSDEE